jgi:hypothetical protein
MSVEFNYCEYCEESIYEEDCYIRIIGGKEISACNWCIEDMINSGKLITLTEDDAEYETYADDVKEAIDNYGAYYQWTDSGVDDEIKRVEEEIKHLQDYLMELKSK